MSPAALASLLLALAVKATLLLGVAAVVDRAVLRRRASAASRHLLWTVAICGVLLLPLLTVALPAWRVALPTLGTSAPREQASPSVEPPPSTPLAQAAAPASEPIAAEPIASALVATESERPRTTAVVGSAPTSLPPATADVPWVPILLGLYAAGALLLLVRVTAEQRTVRRLAGAATTVRDAAWDATLSDVAASLGVRRPVTLLRDAGATMPLTWGVRHPTVLVPADADGWPEARRRAVLLHELAHVARRDCLTQTLAAIACAVYWPLPGAWWAAARLRVERELACDDRALGETGMRPHDYAAQLLAIARGHRSPPALTALAVTMASPSQLESRLRAVIDGARPRRAPGRRATALVASLTAVLLLPLATLRAGVAPATAQPPITPSVPIAPRVARPSRVVAAPAVVTRAVVTPAVVTPLAVTPVGVAPVRLTSPVVPPVPATPRVVAPVVGAAQPATRTPYGGRWWIRPATAREAGADGPAVHVMLNTNGLNTFVVPLARLDRLTPDQLATGRGPVQFRLRQDAGTLRFDGTLADGKGSGAFDFVADQAFADTLVARGMTRPTATQLFTMGIHGLPLALLDELQAQGYARPTTDEFVRVALTGVDLPLLREMRALGYRLGTLSALVRLHNGGVGPAFIRALAAQGYESLPPSDLQRLANQGVNADFVRQANARAARRLAVSELVALRMRGESAVLPNAERPRAADAPPVGTPRGDTPTTGRWVLGATRRGGLQLELQWDDDTQWRRAIGMGELRGLSADALHGGSASPVGFRIEQDAGRLEFDGSVQGGAGSGRFRFVVNRDFVATLRALGIRDLDTVSDHDLKNLAWGGLSAAAIREIQALGYGSLSREDVLHLAIFLVTPDYARALRAAGVADVSDLSKVVDLRHAGLPAEYATELATLGYRGLTSDQLLELRRAAVTGAYIRALRSAGVGELTPDALIERRRQEIAAARRTR